MKTAFYTLTTQENLLLDGQLKKASGGASHVMWIREPDRRPKRGEVISLNAWKAAREEDMEEDGELDVSEPLRVLEPPVETEVETVSLEADTTPSFWDRVILPASEVVATLFVLGTVAALAFWVLIL